MTLEELIEDTKNNILFCNDEYYAEVLKYLEEYKELEKNSKELQIYKIALEYIDKILLDHCRFSLECVIHCNHKFGSCDCVKKGMWAELALQKAKELSEGS